jgi:exopolysaccharide biosynthesis polyprenyl glycosylphosphotransferase
MGTPNLSSNVVTAGRLKQYAVGMTSRYKGPSLSSVVVWVLLDLLTALAAGLVALRIRGEGVPFPHNALLLRVTHSAPAVSLAYVAAFGVFLVLCSRIYGLYMPAQNRSGLNEQRLTIQANLTAGLLLCGTLYLLRGYAVSRIVVGVTVLLAMVMTMARRGIWRRVMQRRYLEGLETRNVLIVGVGRVAYALRNHLEALRHMGFRFKGFITLDAADAESGDPDVVGNLTDCLAVARSMFVDEIYFSTPADKNAIMALVEEARTAGVDVRVVPDLYDGLAWNAPVEYIGQFPTIPLHRREFPFGAFLIKRVLDVTLSVLAIVLLLPVMAVIALLVKLNSEGPVLYGSERIGRRGHTFTCYKFRTMVKDADAQRQDLMHRNERDGILFKIDKDPRITKLGARLRKYSLDELPQFFNVLAGNMSLVGPRPPLAAEVEQYELAHLRRLDVLPGMTGLWQVEARQDPSFDSYISLDTAYVENWNLILDLRILARTVGVVLGGTGS